MCVPGRRRYPSPSAPAFIIPAGDLSRGTITIPLTTTGGGGGGGGGRATPAQTFHSYRREKQAALVTVLATALSVFYYKHHHHSGKVRRKAVRALQSTFRVLTDAPADMQLVATASAGLIPAR